MIWHRPDAKGTLFRDMLFIALLLFVAMVVVMVPWLNPPAKDSKVDPPGNIIAAITWPPGNDDVDLWTYGPGELVPVGYSNKSGLLWNLLRDDLGNYADATNLNYENSYTRGAPPGEYIINVHCYRCVKFPIKVEVEITQKYGAGAYAKIVAVANTSLVLRSQGQELTALRFTLDRDGNLVPDSLGHIFKPLRELGVTAPPVPPTPAPGEPR